MLSTEQAAGWLNLTLVSEFKVHTSDHFRPFLAVKKVKELALRVVTKNALTHSILIEFDVFYENSTLILILHLLSLLKDLLS